MESEETLLKLIDSNERLATFKHWPFTGEDGAECTAVKLAASGFYCPDPDKEPDFARCFVCRKELDGWEPMDVPHDEHRKHSSKCKFLKMGSKSASQMTVREFLTLYKYQTETYMNEMRKTILKKYQQADDEKKQKILQVMKGLE